VGGGASRETGLVDAGAYADAPLFESEAVEMLLEEGAKIQVQAVLGHSVDEEPIRDGGLVPSDDGMRWTWPS
jgi:halogenation protein CepH